MTDYQAFDGHNDTLLRLEMKECSRNSDEFFNGNDFCHIDYPKARKGAFAGGFFAMYTPSRLEAAANNTYDPDDPANFAPVSQTDAFRFTSRMMARALRMEQAGPDKVMIVRTAKDLQTARQQEKIAMLLHIEGAEAIDTDFNSLEILHAAGLRSIGPVWSRDNAFAHGVPMAFGRSPDTGPGLTGPGRELVRLCNRKKIMIDLSHINERGFWDVAKLSDAPLVATHSNAFAICPNSRNLTDAQLAAIAASGGVAGLNFHVAFLREDGAHDRETSLDTIVRHAAHMIEKMGEDCVTLGSDFDGCQVPYEIGDVSGLGKLARAFEQAQFGEQLIRKIFIENWFNLLYRTI